MKKNLRNILLSTLSACVGKGARGRIPLALALMCCWSGAHAEVASAAIAARTLAVYGGNNNYYTAPTAAVNNASDFANITLVRNAGKNVPTLVGIAPDATCALTISGNEPVVGNSPFKNKVIGKLAVTPSGLPVIMQDLKGDVYCVTDPIAGKAVLKSSAVLKDGNNAACDKTPAAIAASDNYVFAAIPKAGGTNASIIEDHGGFGLCTLDVTNKIATPLAAATGLPGAKSITVGLGYDGKGLVDGKTGPIGVAAAAGWAAGTGKCAMCWDEKLQKLYTGVNILKTAAGAGDCAVSVLVGAPNGNKALELNSIIGSQTSAGVAAQIAVGNDGGIFCVNSGGDADLTGIQNIKTMHTSTGKSYAIVNGGACIEADAFNAQKLEVYALPLIDSPTAAAGDIGYLAKKGDFSIKPGIGNTNDMPLATGAQTFETPGTNGAGMLVSTPVVVGCSASYLAHTATGNYATAKAIAYTGIQDMQVVGDTVYAAIAGANGNVGDDLSAEEAGIFSSTALFDNTGAIRAWTPWERAVNTLKQDGSANYGVKNFGIDPISGNAWHLKDNGEVAYASQWSKGDIAPIRAAVNKNLAYFLDSAFGKYGGVTGMFNFDAETPGFKTSGAAGTPLPTMEYDQFSMMVATGNGCVALIQTGKNFDDTATHLYVPTWEYAYTPANDDKIGAANDNVYVYTPKTVGGEALAALGPITTAELSRSTADDMKGYLFVGGQGGVAVLNNANSTNAVNNGKGWVYGATANLGLAKLDYTVGDGTEVPGVKAAAPVYQFMRLTTKVGGAPWDLSNTRKIVADGDYVFILTKNALYRITIAAAGFGNASALVADHALATLIASPSAMLDASDNNLGLTANDEFYDMMLVDKTNDARVLAIATSQGVFINNVAFTNNLIDAGVRYNNRWEKPISTDGKENFTCGPALKMDFTGIKRGASWDVVAGKAEGNLYVTALTTDATPKLAVYRFDVSNGAVKQIQEAYKDANGNTTPYFYTIGTIDDTTSFEPAAIVQRQAKATLYPEQGVSGDFIDKIAMGPNPALFLNAGKVGSAIDLGLTIDNSFNMAPMVKDTASGSMYIAGDFGVRVNE